MIKSQDIVVLVKLISIEKMIIKDEDEVSVTIVTTEVEFNKYYYEILK